MSKMSRDNDDQLNVITTDAFAVGEVQEFDTFDEAVAALYAQLEPGGSIDLHHEDCALANDEDDRNCTPLRLTSGAQA